MTDPNLDAELRLADSLGVRPVSPGAAGFDEAIGAGRVNWAVLEDGSLVVTPQRVAGQPINHTVLSRGNPVRAAGEAEIAGNSSSGYFGLDFNIKSGHFKPCECARGVGLDAFARYGIHF